MFNQLTRYVFDQWLPQTSTAADGVEAASSPPTSRLTSTLSDDDWVVVDSHVDSEGNSTCSSLESLDDGLQLVERGPDRVVVVDSSRLPAPALLARTNSTSSLPCSAMEESWFLTPPPCFISTGPVQVETSPLENLLIEHPSMSVYTHHARRYNRVATPEPQDDEDVLVEEDEEEAVVVVRRAPRVNRVHILQIQERQGVKGRQAQKMQAKQACKNINRDSLNRTNKAREISSRNRRQRRGERSQGSTRSYANNNRKC